METLNKFSVADFFSSVDKKDLEAFADYYTEDAVFRFGNYPAWEGRATIKENIRGIFDGVDTISHREVDIYQTDNENVVIANGIVTYKRHDGIAKSYPFSATYMLRDQQIEKYLVFVDNHDLFRLTGNLALEVLRQSGCNHFII